MSADMLSFTDEEVIDLVSVYKHSEDKQRTEDEVKPLMDKVLQEDAGAGLIKRRKEAFEDKQRTEDEVKPLIHKVLQEDAGAGLIKRRKEPSYATNPIWQVLAVQSVKNALVRVRVLQLNPI